MPDIETEADAVAPNEAGVMADPITGEVVRLYAAQTAEPEVKKPALPLPLLLGLGLAAVAGVCIILAFHSRQSAAQPASFQDLGAGISNATGLRGSLKTRWQGKTVQYQLEVKPIDPLASAGFSFVTANPPGQLFLHMKLLDATGFAVCGKDVLFPPESSVDPSSPGEAARERGQDTLQTAVGDDGKVVSLSAQGTLACAPEQYKQVSYWDFSTNFPVLAEQDELMNHSADLKARQEVQKRTRAARQKAPRSAFYTEGDDQAAAYDASRNVLETELGRNFLVTGPGQQSAASLWASSGVLFRYQCDQHAHCMLARAGGQSLSVTALQ